MPARAVLISKRAADQMIGNSVTLQECEQRSVRETSEPASNRLELCGFTKREQRIPVAVV